MPPPCYNGAHRQLCWMPSPTMSAPEEESATYDANCHCGAVKFTVTLRPPLEKQTLCDCNCSICTKNGYLLVYPARPDVVFTQGYEHVSEYYFGSKKKAQVFCPTCGSSIMIDFKGNSRRGGDVLGINARMLKDVDVSKLNCDHVDGKNTLGPAYEV